jgi:hypothetical protein
MNHCLKINDPHLQRNWHRYFAAWHLAIGA